DEEGDDLLLQALVLGGARLRQLLLLLARRETHQVVDLGPGDGRAGDRGDRVCGPPGAAGGAVRAPAAAGHDERGTREEKSEREADSGHRKSARGSKIQATRRA